MRYDFVRSAISMTEVSTLGRLRDDDNRPFVMPCRQLSISAPMRWVRLGWRGVRRAGWVRTAQMPG